MTTPFNALRQRCGLTLVEAADFLGVSKNTIQKWNRGAYNPPQGVIDQLRNLNSLIEDRVDDMIEAYADSDVDEGVTIALSAPPGAAGLPAGAVTAMLGAFIAMIANPVEIVERVENAEAWLAHEHKGEA